MTLRKLFASLGLLLVLLAGQPAQAQQDNPLVPVPQPGLLQQDAPKLAPARPELLDFIELFNQMLQQAAPQQPTPAQLENLYHQVWEKIGESYHTPSALKDWAQWENKYDGKLATPDDLYKALKELTGSLGDKWTDYVSPADIQQARQDAANGVVELGIELKAQADGSYRIDYLSYGSPAHKSDLRKGDLVKSLAGKQLTGLTADEVAKLLKGKVGTKVQVVYNNGSRDVTVDLTFAVTPPASVESRLLPGNIAYVRLPDFSSDLVIAEFLVALDDLNTRAQGNLEGIIFDLRGNPGGQFLLAVELSSMFLEKGTIVTGTTRNDRMVSHQTWEVIPNLPHTVKAPPTDLQALTRIMQTKPLVVLTDGSTASAAEIVTGALKDNGRATIIGGTTYGKGVGYNRYNLPVGGVLLVTTLDYLTPSGFNLSNKGIAPNVAVDQPRGSQVDEQLDTAVKTLKDQILNPTKAPGGNGVKSNDFHKVRRVIHVAILAVALLLLVNLRRSRMRRR